MNRSNCNSNRRGNRRGLSLTEVVISTMLVGVVLVGALEGVGGVIRSRTSISDRERADHLAHQLLTEVLAKDYKDDQWYEQFGPEYDEWSTSAGQRTNWDDVDDYHGWSGSPPCSANGASQSGFPQWTRSVAVQFVEPSNPAVTSIDDEGMKRVTVTVSYGGAELARISALRSED